MKILRFFVHEAGVMSFMFHVTYNPHLSCLNTPIDFPLFITVFFRLKSTSLPMYIHPYSNDSYEAIHVFTQKGTRACQSPAPSPPVYLLSFSACSPPYLSLTHFNPCCGFPEYILV
ncbi:unnamed protein product [Hymenolepis diminuta]|uniref:Uncharacterized protein n=1 Tax=Hymenolepis diminuta TaxID=6216 RepID=A0A564YIP2_HYMDI|nr:unnamed protein product [Hymenolepis diminuta]